MGQPSTLWLEVNVSTQTRVYAPTLFTMLSLRAALRTSMVTALLGTCVVPVAGTHSDDIDNLVTAMRATKRSQRLTKEPSK